MRSGGSSGGSAPRTAARVVLVTMAVLSAACRDGSDDTTTGSITTQAGGIQETSAKGPLSKDEAYNLAVQGVTGDPAITQGLPRDTFDALSRVACENLKAGGSVQKLVDGTAQQPTRSGMPMRRESAEKLVSASVRGYCPEFVSQLP
jgi:hypothetical protein